MKLVARTEFGDFNVETKSSNEYVIKEAVSNYCERKYGQSPNFIVLEAHNFSVWDKVKHGVNKVSDFLTGEKPFSNDKIQDTKYNLKTKSRERYQQLGKNVGLKAFNILEKNWKTESQKIKSELLKYTKRYDSLESLVYNGLGDYISTKFDSLIKKYKGDKGGFYFISSFENAIMDKIIEKFKSEGITGEKIASWRETQDNKFSLKKNNREIIPFAKKILKVILDNWEEKQYGPNYKAIIKYNYHNNFNIENVKKMLKERISSQFDEMISKRFNLQSSTKDNYFADGKQKGAIIKTIVDTIAPEILKKLEK